MYEIYNNLAIAVISLAIEDLYILLKRKNNLDEDGMIEIIEIENFLLTSPLMDALSIEGSVIIEKIYKMVKNNEKFIINKGWY